MLCALLLSGRMPWDGLIFDSINKIGCCLDCAVFHRIERELFSHDSIYVCRCRSQCEIGIQLGWDTRYRCRKIIMFAVPRPAN